MTIKVHERLLLTGAAGGLGKALRQRLKANCSILRLSDRQDFGPAHAGEEVVLADLADADAVHAMMAGVNAVVHMGGIETACIRIGSSFPEPRDRRMLATWLSYDDLHRLITACLTTPMLGHSIIFGMSDNPVTWWDNSRARHVGYLPQDSSEGFRDALYARTSITDPTDPAAVYQGGAFVRMGPFE